ncbi:MAG: hypothetical protein JW985_02710 [Alphaproteobacteria bacterium]|nr:hypothetical protein [Alphaproteobacteria bacterium]
MFKKFLVPVIGILLIAGCNEEKNDSAATHALQEINRPTIYYFHGNIMCLSCHKIENYTKQVFDENFKNKADFKVVNIDKPENKHFVTDYNLYTQSLVLVKPNSGQGSEYKNLDKTWTYIENEAKFKSYITYEIDSFLFGQGE